MTDILIRDVPDEVIAVVDSRAEKMGLSRAEYVRRLLANERPATARNVTVADLERFAETFADLDDPEIMRRAWE